MTLSLSPATRAFVTSLAIVAAPIGFAQVTGGDLLVQVSERLLHYDADGTLVQSTPPGCGCGSYFGAAILDDGSWATAYLSPAGPGWGGAHIFDGVTGRSTHTFSTTVFWVADMDSLDDGSLLILDAGGSIERYDIAGNHLGNWTVFTSGEWAPGMHVDVQQNVWICGTRLWRLDSNGNLQLDVALADSLTDIVAGMDGTLWGATESTGEVLHLNPDGSLIGRFAVCSGCELRGIAFTPDSTLWVSRDDGLVERYDLDGTFLSSIDVQTPYVRKLSTLVVGPIGSSYCGPATLNSSLQSAIIEANGRDTVLTNMVTLEASQLSPNQFGYFLNSMTQSFVPFPGGSQGNLCLGGSIGQYNRPGEILDSGAGGTFSLELDLTNTPQPAGPVAIQPGDTWNFQAWYRDMNPGPTSNFTDAVSVKFR